MTILRRLSIKNEVSEKCVWAFERLIFSIYIGIDPACSLSIHRRIHASRTLGGRIEPSPRKNSEGSSPDLSHKSIPPSANNYVTRGSNGGDSAPFIFVIQQTDGVGGRYPGADDSGSGDEESRLLVAQVIGEPIKAGSTIALIVRESHLRQLPAASWQQ